MTLVMYGVKVNSRRKRLFHGDCTRKSDPLEKYDPFYNERHPNFLSSRPPNKRPRKCLAFRAKIEQNVQFVKRPKCTFLVRRNSLVLRGANIQCLNKIQVPYASNSRSKLSFASIQHESPFLSKYPDSSFSYSNSVWSESIVLGI